MCEAIASRLGKEDEMRDFERATARDEIAHGREQMASWYREVPESQLLDSVREIPLAPGARDAVALCKSAGVTTVLLTITWTVAAAYFVRELGFDYYAGTELHPDGAVSHFWPEDKAAWLAAHCEQHGIARHETAAIGDSWGDAPMLDWVHRGVYVGASDPPAPKFLHRPHGALDAIVRELLTPQAE